MRQMTFLGSKRTPSNGFSLIEVVVALAVILLLSAIALPAFLNAYRMYQLTDAATQFAGILKFTRFEAIRLNKTVKCQIQQVASVPPVTNIWADSDVDGIEDPNEKQLLFSGTVNLVPAAAVPGAAGLAAAAGVPALATIGVVPFDQRGAVNPAQVYVFYLSNQGDPSVGARAVILLPSGSVQIWKADSLGNWQSIS
ncbi:MAG TPA: prepilin-type N-terminal cleavage/methylation domain-containing protein [Candidatus Acidoferrum sp.]|nr:prepilin-type N-terminal cleavage/methylation domain-containing protein [Candidatus Acidoferrum sp.]